MQIPEKIKEQLDQQGIEELRPSQKKAVKAGLFDNNSLLVCTPTASGKTLIAEMTFLNAYFNKLGKVIYVVPLKALASEKYKEFKNKYPFANIGISIGDLDSSDSYLGNNDFIICTSEKLDSLLRHHTPWIREVHSVIVDEIHLLQDPGRGPTLEIILTMLRILNQSLQIIGLSATIGNPEELAEWLCAELVEDTWRPVELKKGIMVGNDIVFY
jgi:helicase